MMRKTAGCARTKLPWRTSESASPTNSQNGGVREFTSRRTSLAVAFENVAVNPRTRFQFVSCACACFMLTPSVRRTALISGVAGKRAVAPSPKVSKNSKTLFLSSAVMRRRTSSPPSGPWMHVVFVFVMCVCVCVLVYRKVCDRHERLQPQGRLARAGKTTRVPLHRSSWTTEQDMRR